MFANNMLQKLIADDINVAYTGGFYYETYFIVITSTICTNDRKF